MSEASAGGGTRAEVERTLVQRSLRACYSTDEDAGRLLEEEASKCDEVKPRHCLG